MCVCLCESMCVCDMCVSLVLSNINILLKYLIITQIQLFNQVWLMWWFGLVVWGVWEIEVLLVFLVPKMLMCIMVCFASLPPSHLLSKKGASGCWTFIVLVQNLIVTAIGGSWETFRLEWVWMGF